MNNMLGEAIGVEVYKDQYGERLALKYRYNPDTNQMLKDSLGFPSSNGTGTSRLGVYRTRSQLLMKRSLF